MHFHPIRRREVFHEFLLKSIRENIGDLSKPIGNIAYHEVGDIIYAWLVGLYKEIAPVIPRVLQHLALAIARDEALGIEAATSPRLQ
jgi:hypothetical protein